MKRIITILLLICCCGTGLAQHYRIGDVYTAPDGSKGIVYYLHPNGGGWVVALTDASSGCAWGNSSNVPELNNQSESGQQILSDTAGYTNTQKLRAFQNNNTEYAAGVVDFANGWVLPSPAQLSMLYGQLPFISSSIIAAGGTDLIRENYWCSAECDQSYAWYVSFQTGFVSTYRKTSLNPVRAVRSFSCELQYDWSNGSSSDSIMVSPEQTTSYNVTIVNQIGCTETLEKTIVVNQPYFSTDYATICDNEVYVWQGHEHVTIGQLAAGIYTVWDSLTTQEGCDSVYQLKLTVNPSYSYQVYDAICENEVYVWQEHEHVTIGQLTAGAYTFYDSLTTVNGCDSVVMLHLSVNPVYDIDTNINICQGLLPYTFADTVFYGSGRKDVLLHTQHGCDSIYHVNLTVTPFITSSRTVTICDNKLPFNFEDSSFYQAGVYEVVVSYNDGCNEIITLTLNVNPTYDTTIHVTACNSYTLNRGTYQRVLTESGVYVDTLTSISGCDSIVRLDLGVNYTNYGDTVAVACDSFDWYEHTGLTQSCDNLTHTFTNVAGCDSVVTLHLTVHEQNITTLNHSICLGESYTENGFNVTPSIVGMSTYQRVVPSYHGCDSTIILNLNVNEIQDCFSSLCPEFTDLHAPGVKCQYGSFLNPLQYTGIAMGRHTVITQQGSDPNTGHQLPFLPPGESTVVKLGNERTGAEAEAVTYQFTVDPDYAILLLKFAVVLEDPGHPSPDQPRFVVRVLNSDGQLVESCAEYDVTAAGDIPGFQTYSSGRRNVRWRPWTNVGIDLTDYAGQQVMLQFVTYDCNWHGHFGYAYYTASCIDNNLALAGCNGNQMTLVAPSGFESYQWDNGSTSTTATYTVNGTTSANCLITSATGCQFTLSGTLSSDPGLPTVSSTVYDTICEGDSYNLHFFNLPPQFEMGTHTFRNTFFDVLSCTGGDVTTTLFLTVLPRYNHIYDAVCQGMDYNAHGFHYANLQTGSYTDTLVTELPTGCDLIKILHLTVSPSFNMANTLTGENSVCRNEVYSYALQNAEGLGTFHWDVPTGVNILYGQGTAEVNLYFTDDAPNPANISLMGTNGCGSGSISLSVTHYPSYHLFYQDTLCSGNEYHRYGFNLARQDSTGWYTFIDRYTTTQGCDSVRILQLLVTGTPALATLAQPAEICLGDTTTIHALGENVSFVTVLQPPAVAIGDILCTDNSIVKPSVWPVAGKTAMGIVFYVDNTNEHGWAVHLHDQGTNIMWGGFEIDIPTIDNFMNLRDAMMDLDGYSNTQKIRAAGNSTIYPAAWSVDFVNGWYLPAAGQIAVLCSECIEINISMQIVAGTPINLYEYYWSSTERDYKNAHMGYGFGHLHFNYKRATQINQHSSINVRSVRTF